QDSDLYYLTGLEENGSVAVLVPDQPENRFVLFVLPKDRNREIWTGWRVGEESAKQDYGADAAFSIDKLEEELPKLIARADRIYYRFGTDPEFDERMTRLMQRFNHQRQRDGYGPAAVFDPSDILHEMRLVKTPEDIEDLMRAVGITCEGHIAAAKKLRPGAFEYEVQAELEYVFRKNGSPRNGYASIVAAGSNATVLHYTTNNQRIRDGDLVLIDAGTEFGYFTGDVTRTWPANGVFSDAQRELYEVVLTAQLEAIDMVKPGASFIEPHDRAVRALTEGMIRLGLLEGDVAKAIEQGDYRKFYMHRTSHWLGLDVHDVGRYKSGEQWRTLEPGMVLTIQPGLYLAEDLEGVPER